MNKEVYILTDSPIHDLQEFVGYFNRYIDKCYLTKILLKDGTVLKFNSGKNMDGIRRYYPYYKIFEKFLKHENEEFQSQIKEKDKIIDEILNHDYCFPWECPLEAINNEDVQDIIEKICNCENCQNEKKKCWLKYFENEILKGGKKNGIII